MRGIKGICCNELMVHHQKVIQPPALQIGDTIGVVSPGSPVLRERLEKGIEYLKSRGYQVVLGRHVFDTYGYLAGEDQDRVDDIHAMFSDSKVKAIICSRGGYGAARLLDKLDYELIANHPKILVGYSDITALQLAILKKTNVLTFSGPMVAVELGKGIDPFTEKHFWPMLNGKESCKNLVQPEETELKVLRSGKIEGQLVGGCLSVICSLIGTDYLPDFRGRILILEEVGEEPYRIDRFLNQLRTVGILQQVSGIIFAQFLDCLPKGKTPSFTIAEVIEDYIRPLQVPAVAGFLYGHTESKFTIPIGGWVQLDTAERCVLRLLEKPVSFTYS